MTTKCEFRLEPSESPGCGCCSRVAAHLERMVVVGGALPGSSVTANDSPRRGRSPDRGAACDAPCRRRPAPFGVEEIELRTTPPVKGTPMSDKNVPADAAEQAGAVREKATAVAAQGSEKAHVIAG